MQKRGQITVFIVLGILILTLIVLLFAVGDRLTVSQWEQEKEQALQIPEKAREVQTFVQDCVEQVSSEGLDIMGMQGGYIELPESHITTPRHPFATYLEIIPESELKTAYWHYTTPNRLEKTNVPTINQMESELSSYIENNLASCTLDFELFEQYNVTTGPIMVDTEIQADRVLFTVDYPLDISLEDFHYQIESFYADSQTDFGQLYDMAREISDKLNQDFFLEEKTIDILAMHQDIPYASTEFKCSPELWQKSEVKETLKRAIQTNIQFIRLQDTRFEETEDYFIWDILEESHDDISTNFHYSANWPLTMEVYPSEGELLKAEPLGIDNQAMSYLVSLFCLRNYNFVYDVQFPVMISLTDEDGNKFQFATQVIIDNNQPRENKLGTLDLDDQEQQICKNAIQPATIYALAPDSQGNLNPVEGAEISMKCVSTVCDLGTTELNNREARLKTKIPQCANAQLIAEKQGYHTAKEMYSTIESNSYSLTLEPYQQIEYEVKVVEDGMERPVEEDETLIIQINNDDMEYTKTLTEPSGVLNIIPGEFELQTSLITQGFEINIEGEEITHCFEQPTTNVLGLLGFTEEKCTTTTTEDLELEQVVRGGSTSEWELDRNLLSNSEKVTFYIPAGPIPSTMEELETTYMFVEDPLMAIEPRLE